MRSLLRALRRKLSEWHPLAFRREDNAIGWSLDGQVVLMCKSQAVCGLLRMAALVVTPCGVRRLKVSSGQLRCISGEVVPTCFNIKSLIQPQKLLKAEAARSGPNDQKISKGAPALFHQFITVYHSLPLFSKCSPNFTGCYGSEDPAPNSLDLAWTREGPNFWSEGAQQQRWLRGADHNRNQRILENWG